MGARWSDRKEDVMPRSPQRRRGELPAPLYETRAGHARVDRRAVAAVVVDYIVDGMSLREHYGPISGHLADLRRAVERLAERLPPAPVGSPPSAVVSQPPHGYKEGGAPTRPTS